MARKIFIGAIQFITIFLLSVLFTYIVTIIQKKIDKSITIEETVKTKEVNSCDLFSNRTISELPIRCYEYYNIQKQ